MANKYSATESALNQHKAHVRQKLVRMIGNVTQLNEDEIEPQTHFLELGLDSITLSQVRHSIKDALGFDIPMNEFFDTLTTLELLTNYVAERVVIPIESANQKVVESPVEIPGNEIEHTAPYVLQTYEKQNLSISAPVGLERILEQQLHLMSRQLEVLRDHTIAHVNTTTVYHPEENSAKIVQAVKDSVSGLRKGAFLSDLPSNRSGPGLEKQALAVSMPPETETLVAQETVIALTPDQKQLWFATVSEGNDSQSLHETALLRFCGPLQPEAFTEAVHTIVNRHEALRTFMNDDGETQVITSAMKISVPLHDFSDYSPDEQEQYVRNWLAKDSTIPFPLIPYTPLFRVQLLKISVVEHIGVFTFHHLIADGWSMGVFMRELEHIYSALVRNEAVTLPDPVSFRNYAVWQHDQLRSGGEEAVTFWSAVLKRSLPVLDLPSPVRGLMMPSSHGSRHTLILEAPLVQRLRNVSIKLGNSLFITLLSAFQVFLHRLTGQKEVMVSIPTAGQAQMDAFSLIGNCVNMLPVISEVCSDVSFNSFAQTVKHRMNELEAYQKYSFAGLAPLGLKYLPVMNVVFNMDRPIPRFYFHQLDVEVLENEISFSKYELFLNVTEVQKQLRLDFDYNTDIFQENIVKTWSEYFLHLLHLIVENEEIRVSSISLLDVVGQERLRATWTDYVDSNGNYPCVLDAYKQPAPVGTAGEVYQASAVSGILGTTREWAYVEGGAKLLHIGHLDRSICIRGHQVNLEQLEKHLLQTFQLSDCLITPQTNEAGEVLHLTAYVVAAASKPWEESELKQAVNRLLPDYTRPRWCIKMDRIPLLANGEPDLQVLLEVGKASVNAAKDVGSEVQAAEEKLTTIWKDVLNLSEVNRHESFFQLGGDSLKATVILSKVNKELGVHIPLSRIFDLQTIAELSAFIVGGQQQAHESIVPVAPEPFYPVSSAQKRMYALDQLGGGTAYHISGQLLIEGDLVVSKFIEATREVILRHESFRTYFELQAGEIVQKIRDTMTFEIPFSRIPQEEAAQARISFIRPFYLDKAPLLRIKLFEFIQGGFMLLMDMHHIIADGFSMTIMMDEIIRRYQGRELADIQLHYKDFVAWKQQQIIGSKWKEHRPYWLGALNGELPVLQMPTDFSRPQTQSFEGDSLTVTLDGKLAKSLYQLAQNTESTLFMVLLAAYNVLLAKYSGQEDIIVGSPVAGREHVDTQAMIGMFVNTLALRNYPQSTLTFQSFLQEVKQSTLLALEHQEYPFDELVDQLELVRDVSRNPVFDTMFSLQNVGMNTLEVEGVQFKPEEYNVGVAQVDFSLLVTEEQDRVTLVWEYATKLFKPETIRKLAEHYIKILETITQDSRLRLADMNILSDNEEQLILSRLNEMSTLNTLAKSRHIDYSDYKDHNAALNYWRAYLKEYEGQSRLPQARMNKTWSRQTEYHDFHLDADMMGGLQRIAQEYEVTIQILVQTVWGLLLQKYNSTDDVVFGSVALESTSVVRNEEQALDLQINTVPVRIRTSHNSRFLEEIKQQQMLSMANLAHKVYSLEEIEAMSEQNHDLINHILIFDRVSVEKEIQQLGDSDEDRYCIDEIDWIKQTNYDFNLVVVPGKTIQMRAIYNALVFDHEHMEQIQGHLMQLLKQVVLNPDILVNELDIVTEQEREQILDVWGNTAVEYPSEQTIQGLFEAQVLQTPEQVALFFEGEQLTYRELNERANQLARTLRSYGVQPEQRIGLLVERSIEMIVGILAVLKAGGAYVPIDPEYPAERIHYMLEDFDAQIVLTQRAFTERISFNGITLELDDSRIYCADGSNLMMSTDRVDHLIYVLYTSGTTGQPKGVMVNHRSAINTVSWFSERYAISGGLDMILTAEYTFDPSIEQIFGTLLHGGKLHCIRRATLLSKQLLTEYIKTHNIRVLDIPPALMRAFLSEDAKIPCLDTLICGGERLEDSLKEKIVSKGYILNNHYGPTETTIDVLASVCEPEIAVNLGKPIHNTRAYILNEHGKLQPIGVLGELCISGVGVARGYLNRPELTVEKFVPNPFAGGEANYERMYRTGDLARWLPDGNIEYLGRVDHQVKIRGYRIELGEVETNLMKVAYVQEVVVLVREDNQGQNQLVAYYVAEQDVDAGELRSLLAKELPNYMVPAYFVQLEHIPLTSNGKIDRKSLPAPEGSLQSGADYAEPRTEAESKLVKIWQDVLGLNKIGVKDNFFEIGGHSLRAMTLVSKIHKELNKSISLRIIFEAPTIEQLAVVLKDLNQVAYVSVSVTEERDFYPLSSAQKRMYMLQQLDPNDVNYNMYAAFQVSGPLNVKRLEEVFHQLISRHATLRTSFEMVDNKPMQRIHDTVLFEVEYSKLLENRALKDLLAVGANIKKRIRSFVRPFDLQSAPLLRVGLLDLGVQGEKKVPQYLLMLDMHHIISDGVSTNILANELVRLYNDEKLSPLRIQYRDYAVWQQNGVQQGWLKQQEAYWLDTFDGELPVLNLATDFIRPEVRSTAGATVEFELDGKASQRLKELAAETGSTLYMVLLAAYTALLHQYTGQEDIIVGSPIAGRPHADLEPVIGMFVGTLAMRNYPTAGQTFRSYVENVKKHALKAYEHQDYPFEELVDKLKVKRDMSRNPLFDTMFVLQNTEQNELKLADLSFRPYGMEQAPAKFDLTLEASEGAAGIRFGLEYATSLYERETVEQMTRHFIRLVETVVVNPDLTLGELEWVTTEETVPVLKEHQERQKALRYWSNYLAGYEEQAHLPQAKKQNQTTYQAEYVHLDLGMELTVGIRRIAEQEEVSVSTLLQAAWGILLQRYNGTEDVVFGSVHVVGQAADMANTEAVTGAFINTMPVRIQGGENSLFTELMKQNEKLLKYARVHATYPPHEIQGLSKLIQDWINHSVIFADVLVEEEVGHMSDSEEFDLSLWTAKVAESTNDDFNLAVLPGKTIQMSFSYNALVFDRASVEQIQGHLIQLLEQVVAKPDIRVRELDIVTEQEREQILAIWGDTAAEYAHEQTIHGLFEAQVLQTPEQIALYFEGEQLTYRELNKRANQLARTLRSYGVQSDQRIGLLVERSIEMIVGILAVLKAGGAYVPIDPTYPQERIQYMLEDSGTKLLLTQSHLVEKGMFEGQVLILNGKTSIYHKDGSNLDSVSGSNNLAYVIYTSGTTGQPKGVMLEHRGLSNLKTYFDQTLQIISSDHVLLFASYSFDASCWEIFQGLFSGATLYVPTQETILNYEWFEKYMSEHRITVATLPPTYTVYLEPARMPDLRILVTAGSAASIELVLKWKEKVAYYNAYGPTENSVATSVWSVSEDPRAEDLITIGRPIPNHRVYMVDAHGRLAPVGVPGELCVSGPGLARGYLGRPELTAEKFVKNPFSSGEASYERMYRTGDLARWMPDGNIEYLGRIDHQVKIRGYRIELGEVEAQILKMEAVQEAIVLSNAEEQGPDQLVAYYVAEREVSVSELRNTLLKKLPNYMVPSYLMQLQYMPLTPNGKIDRKALPLPKGTGSWNEEYVAPRNALEQQLVELWQTVLGAEKVGIDNNFFELGGQSLKAILLVSKAQEKGINLGIHQVLQHQTVRGLSDLLQAERCDTHHNTSWISSISEAEQWISNTFDVQALLQFVSVDEQDYLFLQVHPFRADQVDKIVAFIPSHVHPDLHPHYIVPMGGEDAGQITITDDEQEDVLHSQSMEFISIIDEMNATWNGSLLSSEAIGQFPLAPAQHYHLQHPASSGTVIHLNHYVDKQRLSTAVQQLMRRHELLRSVLIQSDGGWTWEVRSIPENLSLPMVDLSAYPIPIQRKLLSSIMSHLYFEPYEQTKSLQYRIALIRLNLREHLLLLPCSHIIFDGTSSMILESQLLEEYEDPQLEHTTEVFHYMDYAKHIRQGPQGISDQQIVEQYKLQSFVESTSQIYKLTREFKYGQMTTYQWDITLPSISMQNDSVNFWDISLQMAFQFFGIYFRKSEIPLWLTQYGRQYGDRNYFESVGEYIDHIPVLLHKEEMPSYHAVIKKQLSVAANHHLNFFNLIFNEEMEPIYPQASSMLKKGLGQLPIVFNYLGEMQEASKMLSTLNRSTTLVDGEEVIFFEAAHTGAVLQIFLRLPYEEKHEDIYRILQAANDKIISDLAIRQ
ncbi:hypothetical protein C1I60_20515 [Paenibacillus terrae]|uniref:Carrier domain-containing protein n=1 Tax=Paenibacillus terrae TaxID=159743 RepID=A0A4U2PWS8_9BACL|nr:non-ribosomal peptide synthetase [Paenibacillus terrae]TKH41704.1 hypothetical protein C1I60_20515 [Paenibacillus terrae]